MTYKYTIESCKPEVIDITIQSYMLKGWELSITKGSIDGNARLLFEKPYDS